MQNDEDAEDTHPHAHTGTHKLCIPLGTTFELLHLLFRWYKFCIPLGTSFELLRLLFRRYKFCIPLGTTFELLCLIFRRYLALHSLWNDFWAENLHCAPLRTNFCSFGKLTLRSLERLFVASVILVMWFLAPRSLRNDFCASATFRTSWVCGEDIFHYCKNENITRTGKWQEN